MFVELPEAFTGVKARIGVALGALFPMIRAHKVLAAYACLAPRLVAGRFDPTRQRAVWPSTGNYCRGGVAISRILGCRGVAVLPEGMSQERFDWLSQWVGCAGGYRAHARHRVQRQGDLRQVRRSWRAIPPTRSSTSSASSAITSRTGAAPARRWSECSKRCAPSRADLRLAGFVSASGSAGTLGAGDYLKSQHGARIAVVEAVECPTLLMNGYGEHNIQGIGDKHVPLIHNVMNTDLVIGVSDRATDGLNAVFNTDEGRAYLARARPGAGAGAHAALLRPVLDCQHAGRHQDGEALSLGPDDVIVTVATDGHELYAASYALPRAPPQPGRMTETLAAELVGEHLARRRHGACARRHRARARPHVQSRLLHLGRAAGHRARRFRAPPGPGHSGAACTR